MSPEEPRDRLAQAKRKAAAAVARFHDVERRGIQQRRRLNGGAIGGGPQGGDAPITRSTVAGLAMLAEDSRSHVHSKLVAVGHGANAYELMWWCIPYNCAALWRGSVFLIEWLIARQGSAVHFSLYEAQAEIAERTATVEEAMIAFDLDPQAGTRTIRENWRAWMEDYGRAWWYRRELHKLIPPDWLQFLNYAVALVRPGASQDERQWAAMGIAALLKPALSSPEAWKALVLEAEAAGTSPAALLKDAMFPAGAMLASADAANPQPIRLGAEWRTDEDGQQATVAPLHHLSLDDYLTWLHQRVYREAEASALGRPTVAEERERQRRSRDALDEATTGLDPDHIAPPAKPVDETETPRDPIEVLIDAAPPSEQEMLRQASPELQERFRMALDLLRKGAVDEGTEALKALGMSDEAIRKMRERLHRR